nr:PREDICTED: uncharacterized protein LOC108952053 [Musa acuminata subsp. malaccensis]
MDFRISDAKAKYEEDGSLHDSEKVAAFDFDGCLANTSVRRVAAGRRAAVMEQRRLRRGAGLWQDKTLVASSPSSGGDLSGRRWPRWTLAGRGAGSVVGRRAATVGGGLAASKGSSGAWLRLLLLLSLLSLFFFLVMNYNENV